MEAIGMARVTIGGLDEEAILKIMELREELRGV